MSTRFACLMILCVCGTAHAQFGFGAGSQRINRPLNRPTVSPYINLLRGGGAGLNYFGLVRPEQQFGNALQQLRGSSSGFQRGFGRNGLVLGGGMSTTGHAVVFDSFRQNAALGGGGLGGSGLGGGGASFQPGFLGQGGGGFGGGGNSSFSPIGQGALQGGGAFGGGAFSGGGGGGAAAFVGGANSGGGGGRGGAVSAGAGRGAAGGGGGGGAVAGGGRGTPWGLGVPSIGGGVFGVTGHPVVFDTFRQNAIGQ